MELAARTWLIVESLDAWLLAQPTLIRAKQKTVFPVLLQRQTLVDSLLARHDQC